MKKTTLLIATVLFIHTGTSQARAAEPDSSDGTLSIYFENDLFAGTDRYYTNGVKLSWSSTDLAKFSDTPYASPLLPLLNRIPFVNKPDYQKNLTFSLGQNIYTFGINFEVQHRLVSMEALIRCFVCMSFSRSVV